ncbi:unnamed protein product [Cyprideis torosa]|uniref:Uncharacterized protein n=1 Tax=Cyprideis torosa TaxID=163714 RepID=A0A7R8W968_9CRUS|nr:unnamed protein product [Cyprideis torosa]CAG0888218.1 unnamed protein product [Cyprideis torosa]
MRWDSNDQYPDESFPERNRKAAQNFCRNPNNDVGGPWCWVSNQDMEYCSVPFCDDSLVGCSSWWIKEYNGTVSQTRSGKTCQRWDMTIPHENTLQYGDEHFAENSKKVAQNFCRKLGELDPWCYTTDKFTTWGSCDVPMCEETIKDDGLGIFQPEVKYKYDGDPFALLIKTIKQDMSDFIFALNLDNATTGKLFEASDIIERCRFSDEPCEENFHEFPHPKWKRCFHFNHKYLHPNTSDMAGKEENDYRLRNTTTAGRAEGLSLLLKTANKDYVEMVSEVVGFAVSIFDPTTPPDASSFYMVEEGSSVDMALKRVEINLLEPEIGGSCHHADAWGELFPGYEFRCEYESTVCVQFMLIEEIQKECNCTRTNEILGTIVYKYDEDITELHPPCSTEDLVMKTEPHNWSEDRGIVEAPRWSHKRIPGPFEYTEPF